jgi:hypothetical protein
VLFEQFGNPISTPQGRPENRSTEKLLQRLHPWLSTSSGLFFAEEEPYGVFFLKTIPDWVLQDILDVTFPSHFNSGFALLQSEFWLKLAELQKNSSKESNTVVGFLGKSDAAISGVYFHQKTIKKSAPTDAIVIDVYANTGTLDHEWRHQVQYQTIDAIKEGAYTYLPRGCQWPAIRAFGELDATNYQLTSWTNVFRDSTGWARDEAEATRFGLPKRLAALDLLSANLLYPSQMFAMVVDEPACPVGVKDLSQELADFLRKQLADFENSTEYQAFQNSLTQNHFIWTELKKEDCKYSGPNEFCDHLHRALQQNLEEIVDIKFAVEESFVRLAEDRFFRTEEIISKYEPHWFYEDLCRISGGFRLIAACD